MDVEGKGAPQEPLEDVVLFGLGVVLGHGEVQVLQNEHCEYEQLGLGDELAGAGAFSNPSWVQSFWGITISIIYYVHLHIRRLKHDTCSKLRFLKFVVS